MFKLLIDFTPWILLKVISVFSLSWAIVFSLAATFLFIPKLRKGLILEWGTVLFFLISFLFVVLLKSEWFAMRMGIFSSSALAIIAWFSLLIKKPFTQQYAKLKTPPETWESPRFKKINKIMTTVFGCLFSIYTSWNLFEFFFPKVNTPIISWSIFLMNLSFITWFIQWFPHWYKNRTAK